MSERWYAWGIVAVILAAVLFAVLYLPGYYTRCEAAGFNWFDCTSMASHR